MPILLAGPEGPVLGDSVAGNGTLSSSSRLLIGMRLRDPLESRGSKGSGFAVKRGDVHPPKEATVCNVGSARRDPALSPCRCPRVAFHACLPSASAVPPVSGILPAVKGLRLVVELPSLC